MDYRCTNPRCGKLWEYPGECPSCGHSFLVPQPIDIRGASPTYQHRRRASRRSFAELDSQQSRVRKYRWGYPQLWLPLEVGISVEGPPGSGKSTLATLAAQDLGRQGIPVLYVAAEEGQGEALSLRIRRCCKDLLGGVPPSPAVEVTDARNAYELDNDLVSFPRGVVVLDSATEMRLNPAYLVDLRARGLGVIVIQHWTTQRQPKGGLGTNYAVDVCLRVVDQRITATKSRWGALESWGLQEVPQPPSEGSEGTGEVLSFPVPAAPEGAE